MELQKNVDGTEVLTHLTLNVSSFYGDMTQRDLAVELAAYLAKRLPPCALTKSAPPGCCVS